jgi:hypothetical protein
VDHPQWMGYTSGHKIRIFQWTPLDYTLAWTSYWSVGGFLHLIDPAVMGGIYNYVVPRLWGPTGP